MKTPESSAAEGRAVRMIRALANPVRFRIVVLLAERKDATSPGLVAELGIAQSSLFDHLAALREAGVVQVSQPGQSGAQAQARGDAPPGLARTYCLDPGALDFLSAFLAGLGERARLWERLVATARREDGMEIREATLDEAAGIAHIYNQGIEDRVATLETTLRTPEERADWLGARSTRHPVLVATRADNAAPNGTVLGWASLNQFNPRPAYDHVVDISVYVGREHRGKGIGDALLGALEGRARALGYHKMVLAAFPSNAPGMRLYERHGFRTVGIYHEQGMLDGRWVDVIVMEKILA
jgi:L-amino acid N-acyltransferase YncA/DNA-binding transcriptional ArsR family regulator